MLCLSLFDLTLPCSLALVLRFEDLWVMDSFEDLGVDRERLSLWQLSQYQRIYPAHASIFVDIRSSSVEPNPEPVLSPAEIKPKLEPEPEQNPSPNAEPNFAPVSDSEVESEVYWRSPTEIGQLIATEYELGFAPSPQEVNGTLAKLNLQTHFPVGNKKKWKLTKSGQSYGRVANCFDPLGKKRPHIRWSTDVVPIVAQQMGLSKA